jgi:hypothetical protein
VTVKNDFSVFDLMVKAQEDGMPLTINHPVTGAPLDMTIVVCGRDSAAFRAATRWQLDEAIERAASASGPDDDMRGRDVQAGFVARLCKSWAGDWGVDGEPVKFSVEAATKLFVRFHFIEEQVNAFAGRRANFTKG